MRMNALKGLAVVAFLAAGTLGSGAAQQPANRPGLKCKLVLPAYPDGGVIPARYTCVDPNASSPALGWSNPPRGTVSFAVIMHDTEAAPGKGSMDVTHWIFWNVPANLTWIPPDVKPGTSPDGIAQGQNTHKVEGYLPPCPPPGSFPHHYIIELYALDTKLDLPAGSSRADLLKAMDGHVIGKSAYVGRFSR
ncbi:MAG: YbhB/YbcL family Raf kinase inhibitor-like protein [Terriglobia bacterium]